MLVYFCTVVASLAKDYMCIMFDLEASRTMISIIGSMVDVPFYCLGDLFPRPVLFYSPR